MCVCVCVPVCAGGLVGISRLDFRIVNHRIRKGAVAVNEDRATRKESGYSVFPAQFT